MATLIELVRSKTTDDPNWLPNEQIQLWLDYWADDWRMAAADSLEYMARDDIYETYSRGGIQVSKPLLHERARELRAQVTGEAGYTVVAGNLVRGDEIVATAEEIEYGIDHPPYTYGEGVLHTVKKTANNGQPYP